ncbi:MAG: hypothetical protein IKQ77_16260 [Prevotella sp.]|nr:hypothetical protein [Prevotella sp.]
MKKKTKTTTAIIRLSKQRMIYDIANNAFVVGETIEDAGPHIRHLVQDVVEGQNIDRVCRVMSLAFCRVKDLLRQWVVDVEETGCSLSTHQNAGEEEYVLRIVVPYGLPPCTIDYWVILAYEYVTASAIADWLGITAKDKAPEWQRKADEAAERLFKGVSLCHRHARKRMEVV